MQKSEGHDFEGEQFLYRINYPVHLQSKILKLSGIWGELQEQLYGLITVFDIKLVEDGFAEQQ